MRKNVCLKVLSLGLAALLIISLGGCGKKEEVKKTTADSFKEVTPEAKAEETMKAFSNDTPYGYGDIGVEQTVLHSPTEEWQYAHGATIDYFDGTFYCVWGVAKVNEGDPGGHLLMSTSKDGKKWSTPQKILGEPKYADSGIQYSYGLRGLFFGDGTIVVS